MLRPPMNEKPRSSTSNPSGTMMLMPPQKAKAVISTSGPSISARRRSMSQPPMTATAFVLPPMRQRPLVLCPLMIATCQRLRLAGRAERCGGPATPPRASAGRSAMTASSSPRVLASSAAPDPLGELVERQPALDDVLAQLRHRAVPVGVRDALGQPGRPRAGMAGSAGPREPGRSAIADSLPRSAAGPGPPRSDDPSDSRGRSR